MCGETRAGHEPSRAEFGSSLHLARWLNMHVFGGSARLASGSVQPERLVCALLYVCAPVQCVCLRASVSASGHRQKRART